MTLEERIERLEKLWERDRQTLEMAGVLIESLTDIVIKYWSANGRQNNYLMSINKVLSGELSAYNSLLLEHFKSHYSKEKYKKQPFNSKRKTIIYKDYNIGDVTHD